MADPDQFPALVVTGYRICSPFAVTVVFRTIFDFTPNAYSA
jgi:hypothetical protein